MSRRVRGSIKLVNCASCGRRVPRDKALAYDRVTVYSTDLKTSDDVRTMLRREMHYCPSCAKHLRLYAKKAEMMARRSHAWGGQDRESQDRWGTNERFEGSNSA
jgi:ribosomal protein S26